MDKIREAALMIKEHKGRIIVLTGAGISTDSGIPDFRSKGTGLWEKIDPMECLSRDTLEKNPNKFYENFNPFREAMLDKKPNKAHALLALLEEKGYVSHIVTQNIDDLHQKAGSKNVMQVHGNLIHCYCTTCGHQGYLYEELDNPCDVCGTKTLRPDVVLFGDEVTKFGEAADLTLASTLLIAIGTSLSVSPINQLVSFTDKFIIINRDKTILDDEADIVINDDIATALGEINKEIHTQELVELSKVNGGLAWTFIDGKPAPWTPFGADDSPRTFARKKEDLCEHCGYNKKVCMCVKEDDSIIPVCPICGERMDNCMCGEEE